jgi:hypothetical protein
LKPQSGEYDSHQQSMLSVKTDGTARVSRQPESARRLRIQAENIGHEASRVLWVALAEPITINNALIE